MDQQQQSRWRPAIRYVLWSVGVVVALVILIRIGYAYQWTGFGQTKVSENIEPAKSLWDWLELLIIPVVLGAGGIWFNRRQREQELRIAEQQRERDRERESERAQDEALRAYLDQMSHLLLEEDLRGSSEEDGEVRTLARARTLTLLSGLDGKRRARVVQFLYEAALINKDRPAISLEGADLTEALLVMDVLRLAALAEVNLNRANLFQVDLTGADLREAILVKADLGSSNLEGVILRGGYLWGADFRFANLSEADLSNAKLSLRPYQEDPPAVLEYANLSRATLARASMNEVSLRNAHLYNANLGEANLGDADLSGADLSGADLSGVDLSGANLRGSVLTGAMGISNEQLELQSASLEGATMPNGQKYEDWLKSKGSGEDGENGGSS